MKDFRLISCLSALPFVLDSKKIILPFLIVFFMAACAHHPALPVSRPRPAALWQKILLRGNTQAQAFEVSFSLVNTGADTKRYRLTGQLWGNTKGPVRLDLRAGIGKLVAMIAEKNDQWLFYNALQQTAYKGQINSLSRELTIVLPFSLKTLGAVMLGSVKELLPPDYQKATVTPDGAVLYHFKKGTGLQTLKASPNGLPMHLESDTWQIAWPDWNTGTVPPRLSFKNAQTSIFLFIKNHAFYNNKRPDSETQLLLPPGIEILQR